MRILISIILLYSVAVNAQTAITSVTPPLNRTGNQVGLSVVPISLGGTAATTKETALNNLLPTQAVSTTNSVLSSTGITHKWIDASTIASNLNVNVISANYTALVTDVVIINTGTNTALALPDPSTVENKSYILVNDGIGDFVINYNLQADKNQTINYIPSYSAQMLPAFIGNKCQIVAKNSKYYIIKH